MYRYGENHIRRRHQRMLAAAAAVLLVVGGTILTARALHTKTNIGPTPPAIVKQVTPPSVQTKHIDESLFSLDLPKDWKLESHDTAGGNNIYTWANTVGNAGVRKLTLYIDTPQPTLGINHAIAVQGNNDQITLASDVSDNCASFTNRPTSGQTDTGMAKWDGLDFLCDLGNYTRDVVGTVSSDGINKIIVTGSTTGRHSLFFTYTDNDNQPNYAIYASALQSFRLK